jgi:cell shape-determining protein MreC
MADPLGKSPKRWILTAMLIAAVVFSLSGPDFSARLRGAVSHALVPFGDAGTYLTTALKVGTGRASQPSISPTEMARVLEENQELRRRFHAVEGELARYIRRDAALDWLYGYVPYSQWKLIPARIVGSDALPYGQTRVVNAGESQGARRGARVTTRWISTDRSKALPESLMTIAELPDQLAEICGAVLVGQVTHTSAYTARCVLITDRNFRINGRIRRIIDKGKPRTITRTDGDAQEVELTEENNVPIDVTAVGDGRGGLTVSDVYAYDNVRKGDWLVTAGDESFVPTEIQIGTVTEVRAAPERKGLFVSLRIAPAVDLDALRDVYIVLPIGMAGERRNSE